MYWDKMLLQKSGKEEIGNELVISNERPSFFADRKGFTIKSLEEGTLEINQETLERVSSFYIKHNLMASGNMNRIRAEDLMKFINIGAEPVIVTKSVLGKEKILGSILSIILPIKINTDLILNDRTKKTSRYRSIVSETREKDVFLVANTTFLNNHKKYRGKGLGMVLIQKSLQVAYDVGVICAYFLNTVQRSTNAIKINNWVFHANPDRLDKLGLPYDRRYRSKLIFPAPCLVERVTEMNSQEALDTLLSLTKDKKFYFCPDLPYWNLWIKNHRTYLVKEQGVPVGLFTLNRIDVWIPLKKCEVRHGNVLLCVGEQPKTLRSLLATCRETDFDMIILQEAGDFNRSLLKSVWAVPTGSTDWMNFYNCNVQLVASDIYVPLM